MIKFITDHPDYFILLMVCLFLVIRTLIHIACEKIIDEQNNDGDGGILFEDPILDLPPGVTLPQDSPQEEAVI